MVVAGESGLEPTEGGDDRFVERYIDGREFNLSLLASEEGQNVEVLPPAEIAFVDFPPGKPRIVGYAAKWRRDSYEYSHTPRQFGAERTEPLLAHMLSDLARQCWALFGLRGYARVDFRVDRWNRPWVIEINGNPCLSPDAGFMAAAKEAGLSPADVIRRIGVAGLGIAERGAVGRFGAVDRFGAVGADFVSVAGVSAVARSDVAREDDVVAAVAGGASADRDDEDGEHAHRAAVDQKPCDPEVRS